MCVCVFSLFVCLNQKKEKENMQIKAKKQRQHDTWPLGQFRRRQSQRILNCRVCKKKWAENKKNIINKYKFILHIVDEALLLLLLLLVRVVVVVVCVFFAFFVKYTPPSPTHVVAAAGGALSTSFYEGSQHFSIYFQCFSQKKKKY